jgi:hypothetical protein
MMSRFVSSSTMPLEAEQNYLNGFEVPVDMPATRVASGRCSRYHSGTSHEFLEYRRPASWK